VIQCTQDAECNDQGRQDEQNYQVHLMARQFVDRDNGPFDFADYERYDFDRSEVFAGVGCYRPDDSLLMKLGVTFD